MRVDRKVGFSGKGRGSGESGGVMGEYPAEGGWTYLDPWEAAQQVPHRWLKIMELGGVRATVFDYTHKRCDAGDSLRRCAKERLQPEQARERISLVSARPKGEGTCTGL